MAKETLTAVTVHFTKEELEAINRAAGDDGVTLKDYVHESAFSSAQIDNWITAKERVQPNVVTLKRN